MKLSLISRVFVFQNPGTGQLRQDANANFYRQYSVGQRENVGGVKGGQQQLTTRTCQTTVR